LSKQLVASTRTASAMSRRSASVKPMPWRASPGPFARNGGKRSDARAEWEKRRIKNAAKAAAAHDAAAWHFTQSEPRRVV